MSEYHTRLDRNNPFLGLRPFSELEQDYFKGRQAEISNLLRHLKREVLTVLFGISGLGKTSLLRAGLFPLARGEDYFPILIRLTFGAGEASGTDQVKKIVSAAINKENIDAPLPEKDESLWRYFHRVQFWSSRNELLTPVLVFDQFEEIFTLGQRSHGVMEFISELACLIENRIPAAEQKALAEVDELPFSIEQQNYRVIVSLREDFLADLESLQKRIPSLAINRMRLLPMNGVASLEVVSQVPDLIREDVAEQVVRFVAAEGPDKPLTDFEIEPALLSVFCRELNNKRLVRGDDQITVDLLKGSKEQILHDFYEKSVEHFNEQVRRFIEEEMLTTTGYRNSVALEDALEHDGVTDEVISELINDRLVRVEERAGVKRMELTHDLLTREIKNSRDKRRSREAMLAQAQAREQAEIEAIKTQKQLRRSRKIALMILGLLIISIGLGGFAWRTKIQVVRTNMQVVEERKQVVKERDRAIATAEKLDATLRKAHKVSEPVLKLRPLLDDEVIDSSEHEQVSEGVRVAVVAAEAFNESLVTALLNEAKELWEANKFNDPEGPDALEKYSLVLEIRKFHPDAVKALDEIAKHFREKAQKEYDAENYQAAKNLAAEGLLAKEGDAELRKIHNDAINKLGAKQQKIRGNLLRAEELVQEEKYLLPPNENANQFYENVLAIERTNSQALKGKSEIQDLVDLKIIQLQDNRKWSEAYELAKAAQGEFNTDERFSKHVAEIDRKITRRDTLLTRLQDLLEKKVISLEDIDEAAKLFTDLDEEYPSDEYAMEQRALWIDRLDKMGDRDKIEGALKYFPGNPELNNLLQRERELERLTKLGRNSAELERSGQLEIVIMPWGKVVEILDKTGKEINDNTIAGPTPRIISLPQGSYTVIVQSSDGVTQPIKNVEVKARSLERVLKRFGTLDADNYFKESRWLDDRG